MSQTYDPTKPISGTTLFGGMYQIIKDHFAAVVSRFSGTSFPANPTTYQVSWRSDRGTYGRAYCYTGDPAVGESGWVEDALLTSIGVEIIAARGSAASLDARLDVALNEDGTLKASTTLNPSEWFALTGHTFTYSNSTTFTVNGDQTAIYKATRRLKANLAGGAVYSEVLSSSYGAPNTSVVIKDAVLDNTLTTVDHSLFLPRINSGALSYEMLANKNGRTVTGTDTSKINDSIIRCNKATAMTENLLSAATYGLGRRIIIVNINVGAVTIDPAGAETINGAATYVLSSQYQTAELESDGTNWNLIGSSDSTGTSDLVNNLKPVVNAAVNKLDIFTKSGGAVPDATDFITISIPDGNGYTARTRKAAYLSGTSQFILADGANYWNKGSLDVEIKTAYIYAIWDAAGGIVWALAGYAGFTRVPASVTATDDDFFLLEASSTYTKVITDYCVCVGKIRYQYDTADNPDHTIQATALDAPQVIWNPKSDYSKTLNLATTVVGSGDIAEYSAISAVVKQSGTYGVCAAGMAASSVSAARIMVKIKTGSATYGSAVQKAQFHGQGTSTFSVSAGGFISVFLNAGDTIHSGIEVLNSTGNANLYGDNSFVGGTTLSFFRLD